jgi:hypothetical protein
VPGLWRGIMQASKSGYTEPVSQVLAAAFIAGGYDARVYALALDSQHSCCDQCDTLVPVLTRTLPLCFTTTGLWAWLCL